MGYLTEQFPNTLDKALEQLPPGENASEAREFMALAKDTMELLKKHWGKGE